MKARREFTAFQWKCINAIFLLYSWGHICRAIAEDWTYTVMHSEDFKTFRESEE